jgi:hypothetical protein
MQWSHEMLRTSYPFTQFHISVDLSLYHRHSTNLKFQIKTVQYSTHVRHSTDWTTVQAVGHWLVTLEYQFQFSVMSWEIHGWHYGTGPCCSFIFFVVLQLPLILPLVITHLSWPCELCSISDITDYYSLSLWVICNTALEWPQSKKHTSILKHTFVLVEVCMRWYWGRIGWTQMRVAPRQSWQ